MRRRIGTIVLLAAVVAFFFLTMGPSGGEVEPYPAPSLAQDGAAWIRSSPLRFGDGRVYFVDVWSHGCGACLRALPWVHEIATRYQSKGLVTVAVHAVAEDDPADAAMVQRAVGRLGIVEPVYLDAEGRVAQALGVRVYPTFVLVDKRGNVRYRYSGLMSRRGERAFEEVLQRLLAEDVQPSKAGAL